LASGNVLLGKLRKMRTLADDDEDVGSGNRSSTKSATQQPAWMRTLHQHCQEWLKRLPEVRSYLTMTESKSKQYNARIYLV
jgi:dynein heavy chain 1